MMASRFHGLTTGMVFLRRTDNIRNRNIHHRMVDDPEKVGKTAVFDKEVLQYVLEQNNFTGNEAVKESLDSVYNHQRNFVFVPKAFVPVKETIVKRYIALQKGEVDPATSIKLIKKDFLWVRRFCQDNYDFMPRDTMSPEGFLDKVKDFLSGENDEGFGEDPYDPAESGAAEADTPDKPNIEHIVELNTPLHFALLRTDKYVTKQQRTLLKNYFNHERNLVWCPTQLNSLKQDIIYNRFIKQRDEVWYRTKDIDQVSAVPKPEFFDDMMTFCKTNFDSDLELDPAILQDELVRNIINDSLRLMGLQEIK